MEVSKYNCGAVSVSPQFCQYQGSLESTLTTNLASAPLHWHLSGLSLTLMKCVLHTAAKVVFLKSKPHPNTSQPKTISPSSPLYSEGIQNLLASFQSPP